MSTMTKPLRLNQKSTLASPKAILNALAEMQKKRAELLGALRQLPNYGRTIIVLLLLSLLVTGCKSTGGISNSVFMETSLEATEPQKPVKCDRPAEPSVYPLPKKKTLSDPLSLIEQGFEYGDAYEDGRDHFDDREKDQNIYWDACDKQYENDLERYNRIVAARARALKRIQDMEK